MQLFGYKIPMWASLVVWALLWEIVGQAHVTILLPPLSQCIMRLFEIVPTETFWLAMGITAQAFVLGVGISILVGVPVGVVMGRSPLVDRLLLPWVSLFVSAPLTALVPVLLAGPRDRRIEGDAVHPRGHRRIAAERIHRVPDLNDDFLKEILAVGMLERIRVDHFEEDPFVACQPLAEDSLPLALVHGATFLDPRRWIRLGASPRVEPWD